LVTTTTHKTLRGPRGGLIMSNEEFAKGIDKGVFPGIQGGPLMHVIAAKAVAFKEALSPEFRQYSEAVIKNSQALANTLTSEGVDLLSGGTDNHLMTLDLRGLGLTGKEAQHLLESIGITANKNTIPNDPQSPFVTSGLRLGTPALTTRGFTEEAMTVLGKIIADALKTRAQDLPALSKRVNVLADQFPLYATLCKEDCLV
jgi:glycine hydroxymethyltransferase